MVRQVRHKCAQVLSVLVETGVVAGKATHTNYANSLNSEVFFMHISQTVQLKRNKYISNVS